jgi:hypothetical protein
MALKDKQARSIVTKTAVETAVMLPPLGANFSERAINLPTPEGDLQVT